MNRSSVEMPGFFSGEKMPILKNKRHEKFALAIFKGRTQRNAALEAGYKPSRIDVTASELVRNRKVFDRIQELFQEAKTDGVMSVQERMERLSEIGRARLTDYVTCGPDRDLINVGPESPNTGALQEVTSRTEYDKDGAGVAVVTKLKLHNPIQGISELNKMEGDYAPEKHAVIGDIVLRVKYDDTDNRKRINHSIEEAPRQAGADSPEPSKAQDSKSW